jgi:hypothetical protein
MSMGKGEPRPVYRITLEAEPSAVPAYVRLRRFLKAALRAYGLRCVTYRQLPREPSREASTASERSPRTPPEAP